MEEYSNPFESLSAQAKKQERERISAAAELKRAKKEEKFRKDLTETGNAITKGLNNEASYVDIYCSVDKRVVKEVKRNFKVIKLPITESRVDAGSYSYQEVTTGRSYYRIILSGGYKTQYKPYGWFGPTNHPKTSLV